MDKTRKFAAALSQAGGITKGKLRRLKGRRWKYPLSLELRYATAINRYMTKRWKEYMAQAVAMMVPRNDAAVDLEPAPGEYGPALGAIVGLARNISEFNKKEMDAFRQIAVGDAFVQDEPWVSKTLNDWAQNQVSLITKATQDMLDKVAARVRTGVKEGQTNREITRKIMSDLPGISFRRARIIARDQASKLNGELSQGRMTDAGLETYIWETAYDERVRGRPGGRYPHALPSHWEMQGKICRWDDPTVCRSTSGEWEKRPANAPYNHPGMEIMCRCVALPNWDELEEVVPAEPLPEVAQQVEVPAPPAVPQVPEVQDAERIQKNAEKFAKTLVSKGLVPAVYLADKTAEIKTALETMPAGWRRHWMDTFEKTKIYKKARGVSSFDTETKAVKFTTARTATLFHELGHATMDRLGDPAWLESMYAKLEARGGIHERVAQMYRRGNGYGMNDRMLQVNLGKTLKEEFLDDFIAKARASGARTDAERMAFFKTFIAERGVGFDQATAYAVSDWMSLTKNSHMGWMHPPSYVRSQAAQAVQFGFEYGEAQLAALNVELGAELYQIAITKEGQAFLKAFLPKTMERFEKEVLKL